MKATNPRKSTLTYSITYVPPLHTWQLQLGLCVEGSTVAVAVAVAVAPTVDVRNSQLALMKQQTHKIRN